MNFAHFAQTEGEKEYDSTMYIHFFSFLYVELMPRDKKSPCMFISGSFFWSIIIFPCSSSLEKDNQEANEGEKLTKAKNSLTLLSFGKYFPL
jgi:hypothetical protein